MDRSTLKTYFLLVMPFVVGRMLDIYSTELGLTMGLYEGNPFMASMMMMFGKYNAYAFSLTITTFIGVLMMVCWRLCRIIGSAYNKPRFAKIMFVAIYVFFACQTVLPFISNMILINSL